MNFYRLYFTLFIILTIFFVNKSCIKNDEKFEVNSYNVKNDSVHIWIEASRNKSFSIKKRKQFLLKSYRVIKSSKIDTLQVRNLSIIAYKTLKYGDTSLFKKRNKEALIIAKKLKDSFALGDIYWNYASYYNNMHTYDSAYYYFNLAHINFDRSGYLYESAKTQYGMAFIKGRFRDYTGSEVLTFKAIEKFKKFKNYKSLYSSYDHLGQLQNDMKEYDQALIYYYKAQNYLDEIANNKCLIEASYNNIANIYVKKQQYSKALKYYNRVLTNDSLKLHNIKHYARIIDNKAFCKLLQKDTIHVFRYLREALKIRDSLNDTEGIIISKIHLAHYYSYKKNVFKAIKYASEANSLAKEIKNGRDYLESLSLLSKLDTLNSSKYLKKYIRFSDSTQNLERKIQNKFTRIAYETDGYIQENERLYKQKIWILAIGIGLVSIFGLLYFIKIEKSKNEKLLFENDQQKANEQVYLITLREQEKLKSEKIKERNRIAEELHDGILGKLFGTRVCLGFLEIEGDDKIKEQYQLYLEELQIIEKEIREVSHKLSANLGNSRISFTTIIREFIKKNCKIGNLKYEINFDDYIIWQDIDKKIKVNLYRIMQEALKNIIKYACAKKVNVIFALKKKHLEVTIKDDGIGFNTAQKNKGIGIKNMTSRVEKLNGTFNIDSKVTIGTTIKIRIPL